MCLYCYYAVLSTVCLVDCVWSEWSDWTQCTVSCNFGTSMRSRTFKTKEKYGGKKCTGQSLDTVICNTQPCPGSLKVIALMICVELYFIDPCKNSRCHPKVQCIKINDTDYTCGSCPQGMSGDGYTCNEVNEVTFINYIIL